MKLIILVALVTVCVGAYCPQCGVRYVQMGGAQKRYNFNFDQFFSQPGLFDGAGTKFHSYGSPPRQPSRIYNAFGQDAETFGSAIGKSIAQRILQVYGQQDPTSTSTIPQTSSTSLSSLSPSLSPSSPSYDIQFTPPSSSYGTSSGTTAYQSPSTHPPEDLPTVQQAYQQSLSSLSTPSMSPSVNGFGGLPGLLPPPGNNNNKADLTNCPWCGPNGGYRNKRKPLEEEEKIDKN